MSDNKHRTEFEQFFWEKSQEHDYAYDAQAWDQLEQRLDDDKKKPVGFAWWPWGCGGVALIGLIAAGWLMWSTYYSDGSQNENTPSATTQEIVSGKSQTDEQSAAKAKISQEANNQTEKQGATSDETTPQLSSVEARTDNNAANSSTTGNRNTSKTIKAASQTNSPTVSTNDLVTARSQSGSTLSTSKVSIDDKNTTAQSISSNGSEGSSGNPLDAKEQGVSGPQNDAADQKQAYRAPLIISSLAMLGPEILGPPYQMPDSISCEMVELEELEEEKSGGWIFSPVAAIDWSYASLDRVADLDYKYGLHVTRMISDRWGATLGVQYVDDDYVAAGPKYKTPFSGYWKKGVKPETVNARCQMIEVPLGVTYAPSGYRDSGLSLTAQFVSVLILREEYQYNYAEPDPELRQAWVGNTYEFNPFSNLHLGVGYQLDLSRSLSVTLSPYVNVPLSGLGHGDIRLASFGLRTQFNIFSKK